MVSKKYDYRFNKKAWMTTELFAEWLERFDRRMKLLKKERVLLLLDNFSGHKASKLKDLPKLLCTKILYLPANTTSKLQPMDAGIIRNFKLYYHKRFNRYILRRLEMLESTRVRGAIDVAVGIVRKEVPMENPEKPAYIHLRGSINMAVEAWSDVLPQTLGNCFRHCNIRTISIDPSNSNALVPLSEIDLDQDAMKDLEDTHKVLSSKRPELFARRIDVQSLLNNHDEDIIGFEDDELDANQLLADDIEEEEEPPPDDSEEVPEVQRHEATVAVLTLQMYLQQQGEDMGPELAMVKKVLDQIESKRILSLQQTLINTFFQ